MFSVLCTTCSQILLQASLSSSCHSDWLKWERTWSIPHWYMEHHIHTCTSAETVIIILRQKDRPSKTAEPHHTVFPTSPAMLVSHFLSCLILNTLEDYCYWKWKLLSRVQLFATSQTIQSMAFSRPEYWSGYPFPSPGDLPNPGIEPRSPALQADSLPAEPPEAQALNNYIFFFSIHRC